MMESLIAGVLYAAIFSHYATEMQPLELKKKNLSLDVEWLLQDY